MLNPEFLAITYGLASAASWGAADFSGGFATKRSDVYVVVILSQAVGFVLLAASAFCLSEKIPHRETLLLGGIAGIFGALGLIALYKGLAQGQMGIVAPVTAVVSAFFPVTAALFLEGFPSTLQIIGFGIALLAVWLLSCSGTDTSVRLQELWLPLGAGTGFGMFFILIDQVSEEAFLWPLIVARIASLLMLTAVLTRARKVTMPNRSLLPLIVITGVLDVGGNAFFALATQLGRLDISAVLASLYPATTVFLAWFILKERLVHQQWIGVAAALASLLLITS